ncbi:MAG: hypothetical protein JWP44_331 [Mucilaginibacter sp.]|nr:hypothetical protein [Mucilaginibacter sp.]
MGKRILLLLALLAGFTLSGFAQSSTIGNFNLGVYGALPLNNMKQIFDAGVGGSLKYEYHLRKFYFIKSLDLTLESGYETFAAKVPLQSVEVKSTYGYVPVKIGAKYYILSGLYAEMQAGITYYTMHGGGHAFDYSPGIGYSFNSGFEVGLRYEEWKQNPENHIPGQFGQSGPFTTPSNFSQLALRLAERF